ncbi:TIGR04283 family arsenosugar biosynthesis glycosyltransferase [Runella slithyformis]|uniref:Glycosyl transferase family 2 n=1 Tax=Runella slithyformis (strain ATCC 29530 / DSM 19594 / LMG 11500 / NCIMB 11436 / LSU 4) TaxID=761193 RepID=A0A7U3ZHA7_RUNSL|nr:TIGR04283 family arsenosugar biosynthesis glycosyltransferase [Runella slithyformis]AEI47207.1 glycosyl transferase family 2 [Runella slithyformis DSM 19594]
MRISVIIPTFNEEKNIGPLVEYLRNEGGDALQEIIVADGGSHDKTVETAQGAGAVVVISPQKSRAAQMNCGASLATADLLYFVHADARPPRGFAADIQAAIAEGYASGCYRFRFDSDKTILKLNNYLTHLNILTARGGDQTLFMTRPLFEELHGFDEYYVIMEEYDLLRRLWNKNRKLFKIIPKDVFVSARKYDTNSWARVQLANLVAMTLFRCGTHPARIADTYRKLLNYR